MKNKRFTAIILSTVVALSACLQMSGTAAFAAENSEVPGEETTVEAEEEHVSPENAEEPAVDEEGAVSETVEEAAEPEETDTADEKDEEKTPEEQEVTGQGEDSIEAATKEPAIEDAEEHTAQEDNEEPDEIIEPEQLEEESEAVAESSTRGNIAQAIISTDASDYIDTLTFYYGPLVSVGDSFKGDEVKFVYSGKDVTDSGNEDPVWVQEYDDNHLQGLDSVVFDKSFLAVKPTSLHRWFGFYSFQSVDFDWSGLDASNVTDMSNMFIYMSTYNLNLSGLDTSSVTDMSYMFAEGSCYGSLNLSGLNTSNVTNMSHMFENCTVLKNLDLSGLDTSNVTDMSHMFKGCSDLVNVNLSGIKTSNVTNMGAMFSSCESLTSLDLSGFNTSSVTDMDSMFNYCTSLTSLDLSSFNTSRVTNMQMMFMRCTGLTSLDLSSFDMSSITTINSMFWGSDKLKTIYCKDSYSEWKEAFYSGTVFSKCSALVGQDGDVKVSYDVNKLDGDMAKAARLGGYFTPKKSTYVALGKTTRGDMFNLANNVKVTWKAVPGAKYYKVYREGITDQKESQKDPVIVTTGLVGWDKSPGLTNGHAYRYRIVASLTGKGDSSGDSPLSYSKVMYRLKTVVIRSVKNTAPGKVTVKYDKTTSGDSYVLQYCDREDMVGAKTKVVLGANNTSYTIGGLKKGKTYYISIRVRKKVNGIDYYTTFGVPKKIKITQ